MYAPTARNFYSYAANMFLLGLMTVAFGATDLLMVAPLGALPTAAVALAEVYVTLLTVLGLGAMEAFTARVARTKGFTRHNFVALMGGGLLAQVPTVAIATLAAALSRWVLGALQPDPAVVAQAMPYVWVRVLGLPITLANLLCNQALRLSQRQRATVGVLALGILCNVGGNALFLYLPWAGQMAAATGVALATVLAHSVMLAAALASLLAAHPHWHSPPHSALPRAVAWARCLGWRGLQVGVWNSADYAFTLFVLSLVGQLGVPSLAAVSLAGKLMSLLYRVPQALCDATLVYYQPGGAWPKPGNVFGHTWRWTLLPSMAVCALALVGVGVAPWPAQTSAGVDPGLVRSVLTLQLAFVVPYTVQHYLSQVLVAQGRPGVLVQVPVMVYLGLALALLGLHASQNLSVLAVVGIAESALVLNAVLFGWAALAGTK